MAAITLAVASLVVAVGAAYAQHKAQVSAARDQKNANEISNAQATVQKQIDVRNQVRMERVKRAQILQASENTGVTMSSGALGSTSALGSQVDANVAQINQQANTNQGISRANQRAANSMGQAQTFAAIGGIARQTFSYAASQPEVQTKIKSIFD